MLGNIVAKYVSILRKEADSESSAPSTRAGVHYTGRGGEHVFSWRRSLPQYQMLRGRKLMSFEILKANTLSDDRRLDIAFSNFRKIPVMLPPSSVLGKTKRASLVHSTHVHISLYFL